MSTSKSGSRGLVMGARRREVADSRIRSTISPIGSAAYRTEESRIMRLTSPRALTSSARTASPS
ncbi:hypothetical protein ACTMTI_25640 [Nonomuraea sp. H19]|uniref:hypothetical protein n=1 Tax=Nonomuraea sp. H19 TaxID=3452206 RepID=UPI003F8C981C